MEGGLRLIRTPVVSGLFYPSGAEKLRAQVEGFIRGSRLRPDPSVIGLVCPHAGYVYSGSVAGMAYAQAPDDVRTAVVIAPSHRYPLRGVSVFGGDGYSTPLGEVSTDMQIVGRLSSMGYGWTVQAHSGEHAEEVQIPFIQTRWPGAGIVTIVTGSIDSPACMRLAADIGRAAEGPGVLLIASSDLSHYHPLADATLMDGVLMDDFRRKDPDGLSGHIRDGSTEACGASPLITLLYWASLGGAYETTVIGYSTSAAASGDSTAVVGYMAGSVKRRSGD